MTAPRTCPSCGETIPADAPGGACPRCLLDVGLGSGSGATGGRGAAADVAADEVRKRFPAYEVVAPLGRGGMGVVFRARQTALDREVALKVLPAVPARPAGFAERFEREAKALARLQHPGIVQVFDFGTSADGWCYLAMELVDGTNLRRALAGGRLAPKEALAIVPQICDALQYAHDHGVVHRDIKPENVLLARDGRVKIADFGLAKLAAEASGGAGDPSLTRTGQAMGTPLYMAPEQIEHPADVDHRADIYSLGVVFYEMLTGELPLGRFAVPSRKSEVDARIDEIVLRTLEKERDARFQQARDVRTEMDALAGGGRPPRAAGAALPPAPVAAPDGSAPGRLSKLAVLALFAPLAVVASEFLVWSANGGTERGLRMSIVGAAAAISTFLVLALATTAIARIVLSRGAIRGIPLAAIGAGVALISSFGTHQALNTELMRAESNRLRGAPWQTRTLERTPGTEEPAELEVPSGASAPNGLPIGKPLPERLIDGVRVMPGLPEPQASLSVHDPAIRELFGRAQALWPASVGDERHMLYSSDDASYLSSLEEAALAERAADGVLGLPVATNKFLGGSLRHARIVHVTVDPSRVRGTVSFSVEDATFLADVVREAGDLAVSPWRFALTPVRRASGQMATPAPIGGNSPGPTPPRKEK
jgi:serine/threonine protein kinase